MMSGKMFNVHLAFRSILLLGDTLNQFIQAVTVSHFSQSGSKLAIMRESGTVPFGVNPNFNVSYV